MVFFYFHLCVCFVFSFSFIVTNRKQKFMILIVFTYSLKCMYCSRVYLECGLTFSPVNQYSNLLLHLLYLNIKCLVFECLSNIMSFLSLAEGKVVTLVNHPVKR